LKRSNRLIMLIGLFLAVVAFVGVFYLLSQPKDDGTTDGGTRKETPTVFAVKNIPLGVPVQADMVETKPFATDQRAADAYSDSSLVLGKIARRDIPVGAQLTPADFGGTNGTITSITCPPGQRCVSVQVDQVSGVGTLIQPGDWVDMVVGFAGDKFPVVTLNPDDNSITPIAGINATSVKLLLQGLQVVGTLLPPPPTDANGNPTTGGGTNLNGQQEIVILSVNSQQSEVVKFAQMDGNMTLLLRSFKDFQDPNDPAIPVIPLPDITSGVILKTLIDEYGVLVPQVVEAILPAQATPAP
jgi:pilus assembly protein CpaB